MENKAEISTNVSIPCVCVFAKFIFPLMHKFLITFCGQQPKIVQVNITVASTSSYQWR